MKQTLSPSQSATLIAKGISADKASMFAWQKVRDGKGNPLSEKEKNREYNHGITPKKGMMICGLERIEYTPIFTLGNLASLLPKHIPFANAEWYLNIQWDISWGKWYVQYLDFDHDDKVVKEEEATELIDALYLSILAVINHVKLD